MWKQDKYKDTLRTLADEVHFSLYHAAHFCGSEFNPRVSHLPPVHTYLYIFEDFSSVLVCRPHVNIVSSTKSAGFQKRSLEWIFFNENGGDVMHHILLALRMLFNGCYRISIV